MALWLVRGGRHGEYEERFLSTNAVYLTWGELQDTDLGRARDQDAIKEIVQEAYPDESSRRLGNWSGQIGAFVLSMKPKDWVVLPRKGHATVAIGEITGPYSFDPEAPAMERHSRKVEWLNPDVPRTAFGQDILMSFGAFMTICQIQRNDAEKRVRAMAKRDWREVGPPVLGKETAMPVDGGDSDLEQLGRDQILQIIERNFRGHNLSWLIEGILQAHGYVTHLSPPGPDKGVDILAARDPLGFGSPKVCVQVKSGDAPVDRMTLDQLLGAMQNVGAEQGLLVSWSGFKSSVEKERSGQFFQVRLWDAQNVVDELLLCYDKLSAEMRSELPLKRIWAAAGLHCEE